ncbi:MAG: hypothetical protein ABGZ23_18395 [Fuerstiella sp.]|nr:hypothetical protein [Fuerstiella sp.]
MAWQPRRFLFAATAAAIMLSCGGIADGQEDDAIAAPAQEDAEDGNSVDSWDRLIYVPFKELRKVFDNQKASAVIPYAEYMQLLRHYLQQTDGAAASLDAVITESRFNGTVEKDVVRIQAELKVTVLQEEGWATLPLNFGEAAVGKVSGGDDNNTLLQGVSKGHYKLLLKGAGQHTVTLELLATVRTSPENRSFQLNCPAVGISELTLTIPEPDQSIEISPLQVLLPTEGSNGKQTVVKASLGATETFRVSWNPEAGARPIMDLLSSVSNHTDVRVEAGLIQATTTLNYEVLRGELADVAVKAPLDARIIDVVSGAGRIRTWKAERTETHQLIRIELLTPVSDRFQVEIQTERVPDGNTFQLVGDDDDGKLQGIHADSVVREAGQIVVTSDTSLTTIVKSQSGMKRVGVGSPGKSGGAEGKQAWEFSGTTGRLVLQTRPVEPRLLVDQGSRIMFGDDEIRLVTRLTYTVERAGVFQLELTYPETLTIDNVRADGMSEFNVDKASGKLTLSLVQKRIGKINVDITGHQSFDAAAESLETEIPTIVPVGVERETGRIALFAPQFLDVATVDSKLTGVFPAEAADPRAVGRAIRVSSWKYTQRPFRLAVRTSPRPAQLAASIATTASVDPDVVKISSVLQFEIRNAGIDTFRISVPESIVDEIRFRSLNPLQIIQQRDKAAEAIDGWVTWTLVLQNEVTGTVKLAADWDVPIQELDDTTQTQSLTLEPVRVLTPYSEEQGDKRKVSLTQTRGEIRLLRHESLSITADGEGETMEQIDIRELELLPQDGYLAFRYFSQPATATVSIRKHEIHEVVSTVVSRAAIEIVTDKQRLANYRCRLRITTSERQRLRIDVPAGADLQAPLLNSSRTTFEAAEGVEVVSGWDPYFVNISRAGTSDQEFLLSFQFRCPISAAGSYPYEGRGSKQTFRVPSVGGAAGGTVVQQTRVAIWTPKDISLVGEPENWNVAGRQTWSFWNPLVSPTATHEAAALNAWVGENSGAADFARQGNVSVYRSLGRQVTVSVVWWNRPFLVAVISAALVFIGFILRRTTWENRITLTVLVCLGVAVWSLKDSSETLQFVSAGSLGLVAVAGIWLTGLFLGQGSAAGSKTKLGGDDPPGDAQPVGHDAPTPPTDSPPIVNPAAPQSASSKPSATVSPSPDVANWMNDLMGGKR